MSSNMMSSNTVLWMQPSLQDPNVMQVYPCRCGITHRGEHGKQAHRSHECFHRKLEVIDVNDDGDFVVYCNECETAWVAPCVAEGVSVSISKSALSDGCKWCRQYIMAQMKEHRTSLDYDCPKCNWKWSLTRDED